jgi:hypothetical protein
MVTPLCDHDVMATYKITRKGSMTPKHEEVEAEEYRDVGDWIEFQAEEYGVTVQVLRVRADAIERIDRKARTDPSA